MAAAHAHSVLGKAWSSLGRLLDPITQDACRFYGDHGLLTVGGSIEEAAWWFVTMERSCQAQLLAEAVGTPTLIDPEMAARTQVEVETPARAVLPSRPPISGWSGPCRTSSTEVPAGVEDLDPTMLAAVSEESRRRAYAGADR